MHFKSETQSFFSRYCPSTDVSKHFRGRYTAVSLWHDMIKPLQGYFEALFNVNQRLQNPEMKESLKDIEQENNEKGGKCLFLYRVAGNKRVSQFSRHDREEKKLHGISPGTFPHCQNNPSVTQKKNGQRSSANEWIVLAKTPACRYKLDADKAEPFSTLLNTPRYA